MKKNRITREHTHENISKMMEIGRKNGFFVTYNHPSWSLENYSDYMGYNHMHAMEIFNNECVLSGYSDYNEKEYDDKNSSQMMREGMNLVKANLFIIFLPCLEADT